MLKDSINNILRAVLNYSIFSPFPFFFFLVLLNTSWKIITESTEDFNLHLSLLVCIVHAPYKVGNHNLKKNFFILPNSAEAVHTVTLNSFNSHPK